MKLLLIRGNDSRKNVPIRTLKTRISSNFFNIPLISNFFNIKKIHESIFKYIRFYNNNNTRRVVNSLNKKFYKKNKIIVFLTILFLISGFLQLTSFSQKNQILTDHNLFSEENVDNLNIAAIVQPDWEVATTTTTDTICTINKPSGTQEGDLLILHCTINDEHGLTGPIGWTILLPEVQDGKQTTASWYKIANASEPSSYDVTWSTIEVYVGGILRITGHNSADPIHATATATGTGDVINPSVTTTKDDTLIIGFHGVDNDDQGDNYTSTLESGPIALYARRSHVSTPHTASAGMYYEIQASLGASPTRTWDINGTEDWYAATVAINSALKYPIINVDSPTENEIFGVVAPNFTVEITDPNLDTMWYTVDERMNNYTFTENDTIYQGAWDALSDGEVTIRFYANNTLGDINSEQVNVKKDTLAPIITIVNPVENEIFGVAPPSFIVEITDTNLDTMWYAIYNGTYVSQNTTFIVNGTIDPTEWGALSDGTYAIRFYANDTLGNINFEEVVVKKDIDAIIINILSPSENEVFGVNAPSFVVEIIDMNLNTTWYTVDEGMNNYTFTENGTIHQAAWGSLPDGIVTIRFFANNTSGDIYFNQVNVEKDSSAPIINIISPVINEEFGVDAPSFVVEITDTNLDSMWYAVFNGTYVSQNRTFTVNGTIDQTEWGALHDGTYTIRFYANNSLGNLNFEDVEVKKDLYTIIINILSPIENDVFGVNSPSFNVEIVCAFLNTTWYTLEGAPKKYIFVVNGIINQTAWDALPDGVVTIRFYANNTLGDIDFEQVNVIKDDSAPIINIVSPIVNEIFGVDAPSFSVDITEPNLDAMWYWIFNSTYQSINVTFTENGTIDPTEWDVLSNGEYTIRFYANDTLGNNNFKDVNVTKDIYAIFFDIISPLENELFGADAPSFIVKITCSFLNITWYTLDGGQNKYIFTENVSVNEAAWDALADGVISIRFYANNTLGDIDFEQVNVIKDSLQPIINITSPSENEVFGVDAPSFSVEITDTNLDTMWYTVNSSATKFVFTQDGVIDQTVWDALADGDVLLTFFANDTLGNLASESIIIRKSTSGEVAPDIIPIIILVSVIGGIAVAAVVLVVLIKKGKISLEKLSIRKPSTKKTPTEKTPTEKTPT